MTLLGEGPIEELLAFFGGPRDSRDHTNRSSLEVYRITPGSWSRIDRRDIESGAFQTSEDDDYLVTTRLGCGDTRYFYKYASTTFAWYYFVANELAAFRHAEYGDFCRVFPNGRSAREVPLGLRRCLERTVPLTVNRKVDLADECARFSPYSEVGPEVPTDYTLECDETPWLLEEAKVTRIQLADGGLGLVIDEISAPGVLEAIGVLAGDVLVEVDGVPLGNSEVGVERLAEFLVLRVDAIKVLRGDTEHLLSVPKLDRRLTRRCR